MNSIEEIKLSEPDKTNFSGILNETVYLFVKFILFRCQINILKNKKYNHHLC